MRYLYLDTEFDGFGGRLISMALVDGQGNDFYQEIEGEVTDQWVRANVVPKLTGQSCSYEEFQSRLHGYLSDGRLATTIVADWPDDFAYFAHALCKPGGLRVRWNGEMLLADVGDIYPDHKDRHNALFDARCLARFFGVEK